MLVGAEIFFALICHKVIWGNDLKLFYAITLKLIVIPQTKTDFKAVQGSAWYKNSNLPAPS